MDKVVAFIAKDASGTILAKIVVDAVASENHGKTNTVTDHPVEEGMNVSDHIRPEPDVVQLDCVISNHPLSLAQRQHAVDAGAVTSTTRVQSAPGYAEAVHAQFEALRTSLWTIVTTLRTYDSMAIQSLPVTRDPKTANALHFTIGFKTIRVVKNKLTRVVVSRDPRAGGKISKGKQTPADASKDKGALEGLYDGWQAGKGNGTLDGIAGAVKGLGGALGGF
jgi:hypothetical protein